MFAFFASTFSISCSKTYLSSSFHTSNFEFAFSTWLYRKMILSCNSSAIFSACSFWFISSGRSFLNPSMVSVVITLASLRRVISTVCSSICCSYSFIFFLRVPFSTSNRFTLSSGYKTCPADSFIISSFVSGMISSALLEWE